MLDVEKHRDEVRALARFARKTYRDVITRRARPRDRKLGPWNSFLKGHPDYQKLKLILGAREARRQLMAEQTA
jgi:hypothetical protein